MTNDPAPQLARSARRFTDPKERAEYLDRVCRGIVRLREDVERILAQPHSDDPSEDETAGAGAVTPPPAAAPAIPSDARANRAPDSAAAEAPESSVEEPGGRIGRYRLVRELGQGGFGTVWLAEQVEPVRRQVALKIIKLGMDTSQVVARFEQERQALALMDHPGVARVIDAGATASGRPYFVMDLVQGAPIHEFCDKQKLTIPERLALFSDVCSAVQHAHMKGIIHRDLKPSNVLVSSREGQAHPTVIDFGIAKAASARLSGRTNFTEQYQVIGTLRYMSPEQAQASPDIDTRADVYSLGVLLYELLTGTTPFEERTFERAGLAEMQRMIREEEPSRPSTRITESQDALAALAACRRVEPGRLPGLVAGELDWIVMKAIEKDRGRRYDSAEALAADVRRFLAGDAVLAVPPSAGYRLRKIVRRHRGAVAAAAAVAAALLAGVVAFAWQASVAQDERDAAVRARKDESEQRRVADAQRDRALKAEGDAKARAGELKLVADFQAGMLEQIDATEAGRGLADDVVAQFESALEKAGVPDTDRKAQLKSFRIDWARVNATDAARDLVDRTILKPAIVTIDRKFADQPLVDAQLRQVLADRYVQLGLYAAAAPLQDRALDIRRRVLGEDDPATMASVLGKAALLLSTGKPADAEPMVLDLVERRRRVLGADHVDTLESVDLLATLRTVQGRNAEAEKLVREVLAAWTRTLGEDDEKTIGAMSHLASVLMAQGGHDAAEKLFTTALARARAKLGTEHSETLSLLNQLGVFEQGRGRLAASEAYFRELLDLRRKTLGEDHPSTLIALGNLGYVLQAQGRLDAAAPLLRESLDKRRRVLGDEHPITQYSLSDVGVLVGLQGNHEEAERCFRQAYENRRRVLGEFHESTLDSVDQLAGILQTLGRWTEAEELRRSACERLRAARGADHPTTIRASHRLGAALMGAKEWPQAERVLRDTAERARRVLGDLDFATLDATCGLCGTLVELGRAHEAAPILRTAMASLERAKGREGETLVNALRAVSDALMTRERPADAEPLKREEVRIRRTMDPAKGAETLDAINRFGVILQHQDNRSDEAEPLLREAYEGRLALFGPDHPETAQSVTNMWLVLKDLNRAADMEPFLRSDLERERRTHGENSEKALFVQLELAMCLHLQSKLDEAETCARQVVDAAPRATGGDSEFTLGAMRTLGAILHARGKYDQSVPVHRFLLTTMRRVAGDESPATMQAAADVAVGLRETGRIAESIRLFDEVLRTVGKHGPDAAPFLSFVRSESYRALAKDGQTERVKELVRQHVADARAALPKDSVPLAQELVNCAVPLLDCAAFADAEPLLRECSEIRTKQIPDRWNTFSVRGVLGEALLGRRRFADAEAFVVEGYEGMAARRVQMPPQALVWFERAKARILRLYTEWDAAEPGRGHGEKLAEWKAKLGGGAGTK